MTSVRLASGAVAAALALSCSGPPFPSERFDAASERILDAYLELAPTDAIALGLHAYDGRLPDLSEAGAARMLAWARSAEADLAAFEPAALAKLERVERAAWIAKARAERFDVEVERSIARDPRLYEVAFDLAPYISREYASLAQRARAAAAHARAGAALLALGERQLEPVLPRAWLELALDELRGGLAFVRQDVPLAFAPLEDAASRSDLESSLRDLAAAIERYSTFLEARLPQSDASFALGEAALARMLREVEAIDLPLSTVEAVCRAEIARDTEALRALAAEIDPNKPVAEVVGAVVSDRPAPEEVLPLAREQIAALRELVVARGLATIPSDDPLVVTEAPAYLRAGLAYLEQSGPFEPKPLPSFYYVTPPDPTWSEQDQREFLMARGVLFNTGAHEGIPGHFLHALWGKRAPTRSLKALFALGSTVSSEGWALYAEELVAENGSGDPSLRIAQLSDALVRGVRCISSLGLHARGWSVEDSARMFREVAYQSAITAREEARRGTHDPLYLGYTLGKAAIRKLREDVRAQRERAGRPFSLRAFHDELLSYNAVPLPAIREAMLGPDAGPLLDHPTEERSP